MEGVQYGHLNQQNTEYVLSGRTGVRTLSPMSKRVRHSIFVLLKNRLFSEYLETIWWLLAM